MEVLVLSIFLVPAFVWLLYELDWMRVRFESYGYQLSKEVFMKLPSGATITKEDYEYLVGIIKPRKQTTQDSMPCWYCSNGHDRQHIDLGLLSYDLCECGASIITWPHRKRKARMPYAKLAAEVTTIMKRNYNPTVASKNKTKAML